MMWVAQNKQAKFGKNDMTKHTNRIITRNPLTAAQRGFSLLEVLIILAIVAIVAAVTYPSYSKYMQQSNRAEAHKSLMELAQKQESWKLQTQSYSENISELGQNTSENGYYALSIEIPNAPGCMSQNGDGGQIVSCYQLIATAQNRQQDDTKCAVMQLNHLGEREPEQCW